MLDEKKILIEKLSKHIEKNLIYFQNVSRKTKELFANLGSDDYLCFDTESCKDEMDNSKERVWCWSLSNTINDTVVYGYTLTQFFSFISSLYRFKEFTFDKKTKNKNLNIRLWVHNLQWDFEFIKYWLYNEEFQYYSKILYEDGSVEDEFLDCNCWNVVENDGQVYNASINMKMPNIVFGKKSFKSFIKLKFYDSHKLVPNKLETIGQKTIKIDEMFYKLGEEFDYEMIRPYDYEITNIEKCYIYNDVYILKEFIRQYYIEHGLVGFTASSIAFNNMLNYMFPDTNKKYEAFTELYPPTRDRKIVSLIDKSYSGGYTYANPTHKGKTITKLGHSADINSSYPSRMKYNKLPYGQPKYFKGKYKADKKYDIAIQSVHFDGFKRKNGSNIGFIKIGSCDDFLEDIKLLGLKKTDYISSNFNKNGELMTYNYNLVFTVEELEFLESVYDFYTYRRINGTILKGKRNLVKNIEYVEGVKFMSKIGHLGEFIDDCVIRKNENKKIGNEVETLIAKTDMNSVYGKFGSGFERTIYKYIIDDKGFFKHQRRFINDNDYDYEEKRKYYRAYASFTTSYGRLALQKAIHQIEEIYSPDEFLYCDTDSIYATLTIKQFESLGIELNKYKLGAWDIEKEFTKFKCVGAKKYILYGHTYGKDEKNKIVPHCAGLTKEAQKELNFENFYLGREFIKKQKKKVLGGYRLDWIKFKLQEFSFYG